MNSLKQIVRILQIWKKFDSSICIYSSNNSSWLVE